MMSGLPSSQLLSAFTFWLRMQEQQLHLWPFPRFVSYIIHLFIKNCNSSHFFLVVVLISYGVSNYLGPAQKFWNDQTEVRVTETTETLKHITSLKMMGFTFDSINYICDLMTREILASKAWRIVMLITWVTSKLYIRFYILISSDINRWCF